MAFKAAAQGMEEPVAKPAPILDQAALARVMEGLITIKAKGLLFIGDPHVSSKQIGRRLDEDFCATVCGKLDQAFAIAAQRDLYPVILGDLFDDELDTKARMLTQVIRSLAGATKRPLTIVGNHEKTQFFLTDDTALAALREASVIDTLERSGFRALVDVDGYKIAIGGSPYGQDFPQSVRSEREALGADKVVWLTHHDLAFQGAYPGSRPIEEIEGVDYLVNGHMHKTTPPVRAGSMLAFNPGNITRMSVDCRDHTPSVWAWTPSHGDELERIELRHRKDVMNLAGYVFDEAEAATVEQDGAQLLLKESTFARRLLEYQNEDAAQTDEAQILKEEMDALHLEMGNDDGFRAYMLDMLEESLREADEQRA